LAVDARSTSGRFGEELAWHLEPFHLPDRGLRAVTASLYESPDERANWRFVADTTADLSTLWGALDYALRDIHQMAPKRSRDFLSIHAGAATRDGGAVIMPAGMDVGKSSITAALVQRGFGYLSDEVAAIDPMSGRAYPFPKRMWLDEATLRYFPGLAERLDDRRELTAQLDRRFVRPEDVEGSVGREAPVRWIVFPTTDREGPPRLEPVARAAAVERLAQNAFNLYRYAERGVVLLTRVVTGAQAFELSGGTPPERAELIRERLQG
jgi:hypothetical protein